MKYLLTISPKAITKGITYKRPALPETAKRGGLAYASTRDINNCRGELTASAHKYLLLAVASIAYITKLQWPRNFV
jgi:hypothetical protein